MSIDINERVDFIKLDVLTIHPIQVAKILEAAKSLAKPSPKRAYSYKTIDMFVGYKLTKVELEKYKKEVLSIRGSANTSLISFVRRYQTNNYSLVYFVNDGEIKEYEIMFTDLDDLIIKLTTI